jgi:hypothetical protein
VRPRDHLQVAPREVGGEVALRGAQTLAILVGNLVEAHALLVVRIEVAVVGVTGLLARFDKHRTEAVGAAQVHHVEGAARAVKGVGATFVVLGPLEPGQQVVIAPALIAGRCPGVVVAALAADIDHGIDRAGSAQHLAARLVAPAAIEAWLGHGLERPVGLPVLGQRRQPCGTVNQHACIGRAGLQQGDLHGGVLAQAGGQHAAGRAAADNDVVGHFLCVSFWQVAQGNSIQGRPVRCLYYSGSS